MTFLFSSLIAVLTSFLAYRVTRKSAAFQLDSLRSAAQTLLECVGASTAFLLINLTIGTFLILAVRITTPFFVSIYILNDLMLLILSGLQGFLFQLWWRGQ